MERERGGDGVDGDERGGGGDSEGGEEGRWEGGRVKVSKRLNKGHRMFLYLACAISSNTCSFPVVAVRLTQSCPRCQWGTDAGPTV